MHTLVALSLRTPNGDFLEDTDSIPFACVPRIGELVAYSSGGYSEFIVLGVRHSENKANDYFVNLLCRPATKEEQDPFAL